MLSSLDKSNNGTEITASNRISQTNHGKIKGYFSFCSFIFWLIIFCSAISNNSVVEPFLASFPIADSASAESFGLHYSILALEHSKTVISVNSNGPSSKSNGPRRSASNLTGSVSYNVSFFKVLQNDLRFSFLLTEETRLLETSFSTYSIGRPHWQSSTSIIDTLSCPKSLKPLKECQLKQLIHSIEMRLLLSSTTLACRLE